MTTETDRVTATLNSERREEKRPLFRIGSILEAAKIAKNSCSAGDMVLVVSV
jgi:hypothetical protein